MKKPILTTHPTNIYRDDLSSNLNEKESTKKEREGEEKIRRRQNEEHRGTEEYMEQNPHKKTKPDSTEQTEREDRGRSEKAKKQNTDETDTVKRK